MFAIGWNQARSLSVGLSEADLSRFRPVMNRTQAMNASRYVQDVQQLFPRLPLSFPYGL